MENYSFMLFNFKLDYNKLELEQMFTTKNHHTPTNLMMIYHQGLTQERYLIPITILHSSRETFAISSRQ